MQDHQNIEQQPSTTSLERLLKTLAEQGQRQLEAKSQKWCFDFAAGKPLYEQADGTNLSLNSITATGATVQETEHSSDADCRAPHQ